jgi:hypothetical protein
MATQTTQPNKQKPGERLQALEREISEVRKQLNDIDSRHAALTDELATLLGKQSHSEAERAALQQAHAEGQTAVQTARTALSRHIGKSTESVYVERLAEVEQAAAPAAKALANFDSQSNREGIQARIQELRDLLPKTEAESKPLKQRLIELDQQRTQALAVHSKGAYERILTAHLDLLTVFEADGPTLSSWLRTEQPAEWNNLLWDMATDQQQLFDMLVSGPTPDGKGTFRPLLVERMAAIRARLKKLQP